MNRSRSIDSLRAIAIVLMVLDHLLIVTDNAQHPLRFTVTRFAMPLFFLVSGHLLTRINWKRLIPVAVIGIVLPMIVPFIEEPNVLLLYALFAPFIVWAKRRPMALGIIAAFGLGLYANGYGEIPGAYSPFALFGLMAVGQMIPRKSFGKWQIPGVWIIGQYPLSIYVSHLLLLEGILRYG